MQFHASVEKVIPNNWLEISACTLLALSPSQTDVPSIEPFLERHVPSLLETFPSVRCIK